MKTNIPSSIHKQKGVAILTFSVILLIVLTLLGTSAIDLSSLELRQARSLIEYNRAFQIAETGLQKYLSEYEKDNATLPNVRFDKPDTPRDFCLIATYLPRVASPACLTTNDNLVPEDTALKIGDGVAEIEMKRTKINTVMYLVVRSIGYSKDKDDLKAFKVILEAGLKLPIFE